MFHYADLRGAQLSNAVLRDAFLGNCQMRGADLTGCDLAGATFFNCDLRDTDWSGTENWEAIESLDGSNLARRAQRTRGFLRMGAVHGGGVRRGGRGHVRSPS